MRSERIMQSKIYRLFDYVLRLVLLNVLIVVPSFSLFIIYSAINKSGNNHLTFLLLIPMLLWLFPSIVATTDVIRQYENKETNTIFKDFFKNIKKLYLKSFIISIFVYLGIGLFWNSLSFFLNNATKGSLYIICFIITASFAMAFVLVLSQIPLVICYFKKMGILQILKLSFIFAFKNIGINLIIAFCILGFGFIDAITTYAMALGGFSLPIYIMVKLSFKQYIRIYRKVEENEN